MANGGIGGSGRRPNAAPDAQQSRAQSKLQAGVAPHERRHPKPSPWPCPTQRRGVVNRTRARSGDADPVLAKDLHPVTVTPMRIRRITARIGLLCALPLAAAGGCSPPKRQVLQVVVRAESDPGAALPQVAFVYAGSEVGRSDAAGMVRLSLSGPIGQEVALQTRCPEGFRAPESSLRVALRSSEPAARLPEYRVRCRPQRRSLVVSLRAPNGGGLAVRYLGKQIARTDAQGIAHTLLRLPPGERVKLWLDTSAPAHRGLRPQNPVLQFSVPDHDQVVSLQQTFAVPARPKPPAPKPLELPVHF